MTHRILDSVKLQFNAIPGEGVFRSKVVSLGHLGPDQQSIHYRLEDVADRFGEHQGLLTGNISSAKSHSATLFGSMVQHCASVVLCTPINATYLQTRDGARVPAVVMHVINDQNL